MFVRLEVCATVVLLGACVGAAAELKTPAQRYADAIEAETPEKRYAEVRRASLQRSEFQIDGRVVPIKLILLSCKAECHSANVIEVSEVGDICWRDRLVGIVAKGSAFGSSYLLALKQPRRDQVFQFAHDLARAEPAADSLPLERRLLLAYRGEDGWIERTLDRAQLSPDVVSFVRELAGHQYLDFGPFVPWVPFDAERKRGRAPYATTFAATDDGQLLASVKDGQVTLLNSDLRGLRVVELPAPLPQPEPWGLIGRAAFSPDGKWLAVAVKNDRIGVLDANDWSAAANFPAQIAHRSGVRRLFFTRDSEALIVVGDPLRCFHAGRWTLLDDHLRADVVDLCESPRGDRALLRLKDGSLRLTGPLRSLAAAEQTEATEGILLAERGGCRASAFSPDGSLVAAITFSAASAATQGESRRTHLKVWRVKDGAVVAELLAYGMPIRAVAALEWLPDGVHLAGAILPDASYSSSRSKSVHVWNVLDGRHVAQLVNPNRPVGLATSGRRLFVADYYGQLFRWDLDRHRDTWLPLESGGDQ